MTDLGDDAGRREARTAFLRNCGATGTVAEELLEYGASAFDAGGLPRPLHLPLNDEPHVDAWRGYAAHEDIYAALQQALVQLRFPVREGISKTDAYHDATLAGGPAELGGLATGLQLDHPAELTLTINPTPAGAVPVIAAHGRDDFVALMRALAYKNEPVDIPESQGAATLRGYNNWDRIGSYRAAWCATHPDGDWDEEFKSLIPRRELYQDRFMILSDGPYSAVPAAALDLDDEEWRRLSVQIRMHHECTHYATERLLGSMRNRALDEVLCDYFGIVATLGRFRADWLLAFLGLEAFPRYRQGGRLQNYAGELSAKAFAILQRVVVDAAGNLESFDAALGDDDRGERGRSAVLLALAGLSLEEMAAPQGAQQMHASLNEARARLHE